MNSDLDYSILQEEPVDFIELAFGENLWSKQKEIARCVQSTKYTVVRSCHGSGKSRVAADIALWFLHSFPNSKVITTAPTFRQVEDILWREIRSARTRSRIQLGGKVNNTSIDIGEQWFALGLSTDDSDRFQGFHAPFILLIVDEAAGVTEEIFNASEGIVSSGHARVLYIGNPTNVEGTFYRSFKMPGYKKIHISAFDTPNFTTFGITLEDIRDNSWEQKIVAELPRPYLITPEWVYDKYLRWGEGNPMWDSRVMGNFPEQGEDSLIPLGKIEMARNRYLEVKATDPEQIGIDVARFGSDKSEFAYRKGPKPLDWRTYSHMDTMETSSRVRDFASLRPAAEVGIDEVGVGAGVYDRVAKLLPDQHIYGVNVGQAAFDSEQYANLRAELFWGLRERFIAGDIDLSELEQDVYEDLSAQLSQIKFKYTARNQLQIEKKEEMKKRGLPSPDKCLAAGTMILTSAGYRPIEQIKVGDYVVTPLGTRQVLATGMTNASASITRVGFSNGHELLATENHKIITTNLPLAVDELTLYNEVYTDSLTTLLRWRFRNILHTKTRSIGFRHQIEDTTSPTTKSTASGTGSHSTTPSGKTITADWSQRDTTSTIVMETLSIIRLKISSCFLPANTLEFTSSNGLATPSICARIRWRWIRLVKRPVNGTDRRQEESSINDSVNNHGSNDSQYQPPALSAEQPLRHSSRVGLVSVPIDVSNEPPMRESTEALKRLARFVIRNFGRISTGLRPVVVTHVQTDYDTLPVYNLTVEKDNVYYANGILVSNCDALALAFGRLKGTVSFAAVETPTTPVLTPASLDLSDPDVRQQAELAADLALMRSQRR